MTRKIRSLISILIMASGLLIFFQNCSPSPQISTKLVAARDAGGSASDSETLAH